MNEGNQCGISNSANVKGTAGVWTSFLGNIVLMLEDKKYRIITIHMTIDII